MYWSNGLGEIGVPAVDDDVAAVDTARFSRGGACEPDEIDDAGILRACCARVRVRESVIMGGGNG